MKKVGWKKFLDMTCIDKVQAADIVGYWRATQRGNNSVDALTLWRCTGKKFFHIAKVAQNLLAIQSSSVASKSKLSWAGNLILDYLHSL